MAAANGSTKVAHPVSRRVRPLIITAKSSDTAVATAAIGQNTLTVTASDGKAPVSDAFTVTGKGAPVVATAFPNITGLEIGDTRTVSVSSAFNDPDEGTLTYNARGGEQFSGGDKRQH